MTTFDKVLMALGGIAGCLGVALAAMAAHLTGGGNLDTASRFLLLHAPVLLALGAFSGAGLVHPLIGRIAGGLMVAGLVLFSGDLSVRALWSIAPWRLAAPIGGMMLMIGWLTVAAAALARRSAPR